MASRSSSTSALGSISFQVIPSSTVSRSQPSRTPITGTQQDCDSTLIIPKSSSIGIDMVAIAL